MPRESALPPVSQFPNKPFEIRDPVHGFISLNETEQRVIDTRPLQRLKHTHQLAMTYQIYPGATHKRFEHSLGVMELAGRAFDSLMHPTNRNQEMEDAFPEIFRKPETGHILAYWRRVVRLAGLCHDIGHLPFSHAAEEAILGAGRSHEVLGAELITKNSEILEAFRSSSPSVNPIDVVKLAIGKSECDKTDLKLNFSNWEELLSGIVTDDLLGADRMDYLIRDSHHLGVSYGRFDRDRLVQSLRVLRSVRAEEDLEEREIERKETAHCVLSHAEPISDIVLGIDIGGIHAVAGLLMARYFMFVQVYYHHTRVAFDQHLRSFAVPWIRSEFGEINHETILQLTDDKVLTAIDRFTKIEDRRYSSVAKSIQLRDHFKTAKSLHLDGLEAERTATAYKKIAKTMTRNFGCDAAFATREVKLARGNIPVSNKGVIDSLSHVSGVAESMMDTGSKFENIQRKLGFFFMSRGDHKDAQAWFDAIQCHPELRQRHDEHKTGSTQT